MTLQKTFSGIALAALLFSSCTKDEIITPVNNTPEVKEQYASMILANYKDALKDAESLKQKIELFIANPTEQTHKGAKDAWLNARESYGESEVYRFWAGPIDDDNGPEGALNAWPLDEGFIDYVYDGTQNTNNGLISDANFELTQANIAGKNESVDEKSISIGFHAIEFLLWGQDLNKKNGVVDYSSAGERSHTDFTTADFAERRKKYLGIVTNQLIDDLQYLVDAWKDNSAWGKKAFMAKSDKAALTDIFNGMGKLAKGELAGERMYVALVNHDQEDEHSCFSDNTHRDIVQNLKGIANVWKGTYGNLTGKSVSSLVAEKDAALKAKIDAKLTEATQKVALIDTNKPFDKLISSGNASGNAIVTEAVTSLQQLGDLLVQGAATLDITFTADLED
jgi:putative iron-regulated protein